MKVGVDANSVPMSVGIGTWAHEMGHVLGLHHEHQVIASQSR